MPPSAARSTPASVARRRVFVERRRRGLGQELRAFDDRVHVVAKHERADVEEEQQAAQREEDDDEHHRHDADEDVGENQLAPDSPQQSIAREDVDAVLRSPAR